MIDMQLMSQMPKEAQMNELEIINDLVDRMPEPMRAGAMQKMGNMMAPMLHQVHAARGTKYGWCPGCRA